MVEITLPYGERPYPLVLSQEADIVAPPSAPPAAPARPLLERALDAPLGMPRLEDLAARGARVVLVVSDDTRDDPRRELVSAALSRLPASAEIAIAVANGTHGPCDPRRLGLGEEILGRVTLIQHDARDEGSFVSLGKTDRGTPVALPRYLLDADLVVATGKIKPHYFAGYGGGAKALFPGLGRERDIRKNHELKREPLARAGEVEQNPCRSDMEEAAQKLPTPTFLLNIISDLDGGLQNAVAGELKSAFREGTRRAAPLFRVSAPRSQVVVASDKLPLTGSLYQASKLVAAVAPLVEEGGLVVLAAECPQGTGPVETVNRGIYEIGLRPRLPADHRIVLVSDLDPESVGATYCDRAERVEDVLAEKRARATVVPRAGSLIVEGVERDA